MQIKTVHQLQKILDKTIKGVKFAWRHVFFLIVCSIITLCFLASPSVNFNWEGSLILLFIAAGIDKSKMTPIKHADSAIIQRRIRNASDFFDSSDPYKPGSAAWDMRRLHERLNI